MYWGYLMLLRISSSTFQMQSTNGIFLLGLFFALDNTPSSFQMKSTKATLFTRVNLCWREYPLSKCRVQMRHYVLGLFYVLDNTPFPHAKYKCDIMNWNYFMLYITPTSPFPNTKYKCDIIYWFYFIL